MVAFCFKELSPLFDRCFHNRIVIFCEGYIGAVRFEEVLENVKAWAKRFECRFQALPGVLLSLSPPPLVAHAGISQSIVYIATLRKESGLVQEAVEVDVVVERRTL